MISEASIIVSGNQQAVKNDLMEKSQVALSTLDFPEQQCLIFGDFKTDEYDKFFIHNGLKPTGIEFLCDTYNATKSWVEEGSRDNFKYLHSIHTEELQNCFVDTEEERASDITNSSANPDLHKVIPSESNVAELVDSTNQAVNEIDLQSGDWSTEKVTDSPTKSETTDSLENSNKQQKPSSWASLFKSESPSTCQTFSKQDSNGPPILSVQMNESPDEQAVIRPPTQTDLSVITMDLDKRAHQLADHICTLMPNSSRHHLQLRGLINRGNWCYINTTLQAILGIPVISHFYKSLKLFLNKHVKFTSTPLTDSMIAFFNEFEPINPKVSIKKQSDDLRAGVAFEPRCVYDVLPVMKTTLSEKGRQEDAEEFLSFLLNGIHDELVALHKIAQPRPQIVNGTQSEHHDADDDDDDDQEDSWEHVGPRNKSATMRKAVIEESLIKHVFGGVIRSSVLQTGMKESSTLQPFFTLQLDIQSQEITTLLDAIKCYFMKENLQGFNCQKTKTEVEASRRSSMEELPLIFIFHLKYFVFDRRGGCQKIYKSIEIPVDLEIPKDVLSPTNKLSTDTRKYKLYAVIYHHGKNAAGGHYTASVHHGNPFGWVHFDDNHIKSVNVTQVLKHQQGIVPYLLFYERLQTR